MKTNTDSLVKILNIMDLIDTYYKTVMDCYLFTSINIYANYSGEFYITKYSEFTFNDLDECLEKITNYAEGLGIIK